MRILVALLLLSSLAAAQDFSKVEITTTKVAGSVYLLEGADGGNIAASVGEDGIVIVDDQYAPLAPKIEAVLKRIGNEPVRFVINTHFHDDHTGSNAYFHEQGLVLAQDNVRDRLQHGGRVLGQEVKPVAANALPVITFNDRATIHLNGEDIRIVHFPHGHTDGDSIVFFPRSKVVHMGDDFVTYGFPFIDLENGGSVGGMIAACESVISKVPPEVKIIPGHGPLSTLADLKTYVAMLKDAAARVQNGIRQGKMLDQLKQDNVLAGYERYGGPDNYIKTDQFIETLYNDLSRSAIGELPKHK